MGLFAFVLAWCIRGSHRWFERSDVVCVLLAALTGAITRAVAETLARRVVLSGFRIYLSHPPTRQIVTFDQVEIDAVDERTGRVKFRRAFGRKSYLVVGASVADIEKRVAYMRDRS
jgi:hypothetical protein